ncbi:MAG: helix-turn-helix domain-containing protein [Clostridiales bacterium]|nr:helix-turn-helix domain-containing protein [Clostridiales bacterium]
MGKLPYETIIAAIQGDKGAIEKVLKEYDAYITELSTFEIIGPDMRKHTIASEDAKQEIQEKLILALPKLRGLKK